MVVTQVCSVFVNRPPLVKARPPFPLYSIHGATLKGELVSIATQFSTATGPTLACEVRRREPRFEERGTVILRTSQVNHPYVFSAELMDRSHSGFRAKHSQKGFSRGQRFRASLPWGDVEAELMWTLEAEDYVQSGFRIAAILTES